jgi:hypothetical protein
MVMKLALSYATAQRRMVDSPLGQTNRFWLARWCIRSNTKWLSAWQTSFFDAQTSELSVIPAEML